MNVPKIRITHESLVMDKLFQESVFLNLTRWSTQPKTWVTGFNWVNFNYFINQNDVILVKNKKNSQRVAIGFLTGFLTTLIFSQT